MPLLPWIDPENFNPGYLMRGMHLLPKRGDKPEWQHTQDYWTEKDAVPDDRPRRRGVRLRVGFLFPSSTRPCAWRGGVGGGGLLGALRCRQESGPLRC